MGSVNKVILVGNLGADPDVRYTQGGQPVANLRIATTEKYKDREGNLQEKTEWHRVVVWGRQAEHCQNYLRRGRQVYVEGSLETRDWTDKEGVKRYVTEVKARQVVFLGGRESAGYGQGPRGPEASGGYGGGGGGGGGGGYGGRGAGGYGGPPQGGGYGGPSQGGGYGGPPQGGGPARGPQPNGQPSAPDSDGYFQEPPDGINDDDIPF